MREFWNGNGLLIPVVAVCGNLHLVSHADAARPALFSAAPRHTRVGLLRMTVVRIPESERRLD